VADEAFDEDAAEPLNAVVRVREEAVSSDDEVRHRSKLEAHSLVWVEEQKLIECPRCGYFCGRWNAVQFLWRVLNEIADSVGKGSLYITE